jgi:type IV pilus biogenesis protein CpaD/CtpE
LKEKLDKDKEKQWRWWPLPQQILCKAAHVIELPLSKGDNGLTIYEACKVRQLPNSLGSLGAWALHVKVCVGSLSDEEVKGRLDSRVDITPMSEEFWMALGLPKPREGIHKSLYYTGQAKILGYVKCPIYTANCDRYLSNIWSKYCRNVM